MRSASSEPEPVVVRMFSGWAESVLWLQGPLAYDELDLPPALVAELTEWDQTWTEHAQPGSPRMPRPARRDHDREGERLAQQVADAIGSAVTVELDTGRRRLARRYFRGRGPATRPTAVAAVYAIQTAADAAQRRQDAAVRDGVALQWRADVPPPTPDSASDR